MVLPSRTTFLREYLRAPLTVAAVTPSGRPLADRMTAPVPRHGAPLIVELGPGAGGVTAAIQRRLAGRGRHVAIERNERIADLLAARYPQVDVVVADAGDLREVLARRGHHHADVVVSGLPWATFTDSRQDELLQAVTGLLTPNGTFTAYGYAFARRTAAARRLRRSLAARFEEVETGRTVWANLPPAFVHACRRPTPRGVAPR
jgi:phosphatidylethanolamine/phosphatidyl-N-methylethanolamine N-methyltransferase